MNIEWNGAGLKGGTAGYLNNQRLSMAGVALMACLHALHGTTNLEVLGVSTGIEYAVQTQASDTISKQRRVRLQSVPVIEFGYCHLSNY